MLEQEQIEQVIEQTLARVNSRSSWFKRPETARGWVIVGSGVAAFLSFIYSVVIHLHNVSEHLNKPSHPGAIELVERIEDAVNQHVSDDIAHIGDAELKLRIFEQTEPMRIDIQGIKQDIGSIRTKLDILLDRETR
ncbi:MAG: hypothetical protein ACPH5P_00375 [Akkermansiaceae bacterium]